MSATHLKAEAGRGAVAGLVAGRTGSVPRSTRRLFGTGESKHA
ncbi:MAG: hypothetical protein AVDCRST_MAG37-1455 [uncultured Rubrobacteraceae bacterium]|uniref:Uncharacterized protein n=1 Tax=uncultured Rubrobacteraceae bacterium TaxID=349277 RepID=A0A6J4QMV2_9ACTN|nr:MAG: hypothetical protein AVDCRST_MAG37-1455 [uncultured Rubrobacteraceae bacterium]